VAECLFALRNRKYGKEKITMSSHAVPNCVEKGLLTPDHCVVRLLLTTANALRSRATVDRQSSLNITGGTSESTQCVSTCQSCSDGGDEKLAVSIWPQIKAVFPKPGKSRRTSMISFTPELSVDSDRPDWPAKDLPAGSGRSRGGGGGVGGGGGGGGGASPFRRSCNQDRLTK